MVAYVLAQQIAMDYLAKMVIDVSPEFRVIASSQEENFGWIFYWTDQRYLKTQDPRYQLCGNLPIVVLRKDGRLLRLPDRAGETLEQTIQDFAARLGEL